MIVRCNPPEPILDAVTHKPYHNLPIVKDARG
jgi:hypothetical protein